MPKTGHEDLITVRWDDTISPRLGTCLCLRARFSSTARCFRTEPLAIQFQSSVAHPVATGNSATGASSDSLSPSPPMWCILAVQQTQAKTVHQAEACSSRMGPYGSSCEGFCRRVASVCCKRPSDAQEGLPSPRFTRGVLHPSPMKKVAGLLLVFGDSLSRPWRCYSCLFYNPCACPCN